MPKSVEWISTRIGEQNCFQVDSSVKLDSENISNLISIFGRSGDEKNTLLNMLVENEIFSCEKSNSSSENSAQISFQTFSYERNSEIVNFRLLETECQGSNDSFDSQFAAPILLASKSVIYHWRGDVQKDSILNNLLPFTRAAQLLFPGATSSEKLFGQLHIVFRDWQSSAINPSAVFNTIFNREMVGSEKDEKKRDRNQTRSDLLKIFSSIKVHLLPPITSPLFPSQFFLLKSSLFSTNFSPSSSSSSLFSSLPLSFTTISHVCHSLYSFLSPNSSASTTCSSSTSDLISFRISSSSSSSFSELISSSLLSGIGHVFIDNWKSATKSKLIPFSSSLSSSLSTSFSTSSIVKLLSIFENEGKEILKLILSLYHLQLFNQYQSSSSSTSFSLFSLNQHPLLKKYFINYQQKQNQQIQEGRKLIEEDGEKKLMKMMMMIDQEEEQEEEKDELTEEDLPFTLTPPKKYPLFSPPTPSSSPQSIYWLSVRSTLLSFFHSIYSELSTQFISTLQHIKQQQQQLTTSSISTSFVDSFQSSSPISPLLLESINDMKKSIPIIFFRLLNPSFSSSMIPKEESCQFHLPSPFLIFSLSTLSGFSLEEFEKKLNEEYLIIEKKLETTLISYFTNPFLTNSHSSSSSTSLSMTTTFSSSSIYVNSLLFEFKFYCQQQLFPLIRLYYSTQRKDWFSMLSSQLKKEFQYYLLKSNQNTDNNESNKTENGHEKNEKEEKNLQSNQYFSNFIYHLITTPLTSLPFSSTSTSQSKKLTSSSLSSSSSPSTFTSILSNYIFPFSSH